MREDIKFDIRLRHRLIRQGHLKQDEVETFLADLKDVEANGEMITVHRHT